MASSLVKGMLRNEGATPPPMSGGGLSAGPMDGPPPGDMGMGTEDPAEKVRTGLQELSAQYPWAADMLTQFESQLVGDQGGEPPVDGELGEEPITGAGSGY